MRTPEVDGICPQHVIGTEQKHDNIEVIPQGNYDIREILLYVGHDAVFAAG